MSDVVLAALIGAAASIIVSHNYVEVYNDGRHKEDST